MNYNCDQIELNRKPVVLSVLQSWINGSFFQPSHFQSIPSPRLVYSENADSFVWKECPHLHDTEHNMAKWSKLEPLASAEPYYWWPYITFIGHKWSTSVSTWPSFHTKHLNRDSSPISAVPLCLFKPACVSYIKPLFFSSCAKKCISDKSWLQNTVWRELCFFNVEGTTQFA